MGIIVLILIALLIAWPLKIDIPRVYSRFKNAPSKIEILKEINDRIVEEYWGIIGSHTVFYFSQIAVIFVVGEFFFPNNVTPLNQNLIYAVLPYVIWIAYNQAVSVTRIQGSYHDAPRYIFETLQHYKKRWWLSYTIWGMTLLEVGYLSYLLCTRGWVW